MIIAGVDEVGRGCLAGPVVAAAVILNDTIDSLNDSKKLSKKKREVLYIKILENATSVAIGVKWNDYIDNSSKISQSNPSLCAFNLMMYGCVFNIS